MSVGAVKLSVALPAPGAMLFNVGALGGALPVPASVIVFALPMAFELMTTLPARAPATVGLNVMFKLHEPPALSAAPQLLVTAKSPVAAMLLSVINAPPILVTATV